MPDQLFLSIELPPLRPRRDPAAVIKACIGLAFDPLDRLFLRSAEDSDHIPRCLCRIYLSLFFYFIILVLRLQLISPKMVSAQPLCLARWIGFTLPGSRSVPKWTSFALLNSNLTDKKRTGTLSWHSFAIGLSENKARVPCPLSAVGYHLSNGEVQYPLPHPAWANTPSRVLRLLINRIIYYHNEWYFCNSF